MHIAGRHHTPGGGYAHLGLIEIVILKTHRPQHGAAWGLLNTINNNGGLVTMIFVAHDLDLYVLVWNYNGRVSIGGINATFAPSLLCALTHI
jgi:hypothetical protein